MPVKNSISVYAQKPQLDMSFMNSISVYARKPQLKIPFKNSISGGRAGDAAVSRGERRGEAPVDQGRLRARAGQGPYRFRQVWRGISDVIVSCVTS
jgi:hypothetical protein